VPLIGLEVADGLVVAAVIKPRVTAVARPTVGRGQPWGLNRRVNPFDHHRIRGRLLDYRILDGGEVRNDPGGSGRQWPAPFFNSRM